jgi:hypothetical protein
MQKYRFASMGAEAWLKAHLVYLPMTYSPIKILGPPENESLWKNLPIPEPDAPRILVKVTG